MVELIRRHGAQVMGTARRYSATREDAEDAYQRAIEILLTRAPSADADELVPWLKTVVKHEAFALRRQRARHGVPVDADAIEPLAGSAPGPAELAERRDRLRVGAEALRRLKPHEVRALTLKAQGLSYQEICDATGWTYTKVNRCLSEGRRSFLDRVAGIEAGAECERLAPLLSALADGELESDDLAVLRGHMRGCLACRARLREYRAAPARAAALLPAPAAASLWGLLRGGLHGRADAAAGWLHTRAQETAMRWQQTAEVATAHKLAAVAASSVVLAGGGAAAVRSLEQAATPRAHHRTTASRPARSWSPPRAPGFAQLGASTAVARGRATAGGARGGSHPAPPAAAKRRPAAPPRSPATATTAPASGEFTPDPAGPRPPPRAAPTSARSGSGSRSSSSSAGSGGEFAP
ncbi:MAG: hypothetical protein QOK25_118 [Thermoleophilaceae bacterium]|nr:hypothetical protein [Thermoleophilaceae bacterium]